MELVKYQCIQFCCRRFCLLEKGWIFLLVTFVKMWKYCLLCLHHVPLLWNFFIMKLWCLARALLRLLYTVLEIFVMSVWIGCSRSVAWLNYQHWPFSLWIHCLWNLWGDSWPDSGKWKLKISITVLIGFFFTVIHGPIVQTPHAVQWIRPESLEGCPTSEWFNIFVLHQNRCYSCIKCSFLVCLCNVLSDW